MWFPVLLGSLWRVQIIHYGINVVLICLHEMRFHHHQMAKLWILRFQRLVDKQKGSWHLNNCSRVKKNYSNEQKYSRSQNMFSSVLNPYDIHCIWKYNLVLMSLLLGLTTIATVKLRHLCFSSSQYDDILCNTRTFNERFYVLWPCTIVVENSVIFSSEDISEDHFTISNISVMQYVDWCSMLTAGLLIVWCLFVTIRKSS